MLLRVVFVLLAILPPLQAQRILVSPYVQPGDGSKLTGADVKVIAWVTDPVPADYNVEYGPADGPMQQAKPRRTPLDFAARAPLFGRPPTPAPANPATDLDSLQTQIVRDSAVFVPDAEQHYLSYAATLRNLPFDSTITYRVSRGEKVVRTGTFKTRASAGNPIRFVAVGDLADGGNEQDAIAWQISRQHPNLMIGLGDLVYSQGRVSQYLHHFWSTYNDVAEPGPKTGAPLFASIPFYPVLGNHDVEFTRLPDYPDAFGAFYFFHVPQNGPGVGPWSLPLGRDKQAAESFRAKVGATYPSLNVYSWDDGPAHFLVLDSNNNAKVDDPRLQAWIDNDLHRTQQPWKFVCFHAPGFHSSVEHYPEQKMRLLEPIFEKNGVDLLLSGHVHNYQRTMPFHFKPTNGRDFRGNVKGDFTLDTKFDGITNTVPDGIIQIVSGGGGAMLYGMDFQETVDYLRLAHGGDYVPFTAKCVTTTHSFSLVDLTATTLTFRQISAEGEELDKFVVTKGGK